MFKLNRISVFFKVVVSVVLFFASSVQAQQQKDLEKDQVEFCKKLVLDEEGNQEFVEVYCDDLDNEVGSNYHNNGDDYIPDNVTVTNSYCDSNGCHPIN